MPLTWSSNAQQLTSITSPSGSYAGSTVNISLSTQGFANGGIVYYSTTGTVQTNGTAVVSNYFGDLGTATVPIVTSRTTATTGFTITFFTGSLSGIQISNPVQSSVSAPDQFFTATVLLLSPVGPSTITAFSDISNSNPPSSLSVFGSPSVGSFIPFYTPLISSSIFFNGTSDYFTIGSNSNNALGTNSFTIELWVYHRVSGATEQYLDMSTNGYSVSKNTSNQIELALSGVAIVLTSTASVPIARWTHIAVVRNGTNAVIYINGVSSGSGTVADNFSTSGKFFVGRQGVSSGYMNGYISNLRIVNGVAVYTGTFTVPTSPLQLAQAAGTNISAVTTQTVVLLAQAAQPPDNNSFYDSANTLTQISFKGNPTQGTFSPYSLYANLFNGTTQYLKLHPASTAYAFGTGDFTVEAWIYLTAPPAAGQRVVGGTSVTGNGFAFGVTNASSNIYMTSNTVGYTSSAASISTSTWNHLAWTRQSGTVRMFINGVLDYSPGVVSTDITDLSGGIGAYPGGTGLFPGYIYNLRVIKGQALYTAAFTPPPLTTRLAATTNTVLLACQGPFGTTSTEYSTFTNTVTNIGGSIPARLISTTTFLTTPYSTSTIAGSIYFNGTSDIVTSTNATSLTFGTSNFTVECWLYIPSYSTGDANEKDIIEANPTSGGFQLYITGSGSGLRWGQFGVGGNIILAAGLIPVAQWFHVAVSRTGTGANQTFAFINGVLALATQDNNTYNQAGFGIGARLNGSNYFAGYISGIRIVNGYAMYGGAFSPSLTPPTASLTGTTTLINGNNSVIYDSSGFHNISTVGTATITTSSVKFGTSSIKATPTTAYLSITTSSYALIQFGTGPFTIEAWIQVLATAGQKIIYDNRNPDTANAGFDFSINASNQMSFGTNAATYIAGSTVLTNGLWYHVAVVRESLTVIKMYLNGNQEGSTYTASGTQNFTNYLTKIGSGVNGNFNGYISDLRVTKLARYTGNFTTATTYSPPI